MGEPVEVMILLILHLLAAAEEVDSVSPPKSSVREAASSC